MKTLTYSTIFCGALVIGATAQAQVCTGSQLTDRQKGLGSSTIAACDEKYVAQALCKFEQEYFEQLNEQKIKRLKRKIRKLKKKLKR